MSKIAEIRDKTELNNIKHIALIIKYSPRVSSNLGQMPQWNNACRNGKVV